MKVPAISKVDTFGNDCLHCMRNCWRQQCCAFFDVAAATASPAHLFVNAAVSVLYLWSFFNAAYAGLGTLPDGLQVKSSEKSSVHLHCRPGGNAGGGN